ncbi:MAG: hypothetical protein KDB00_30300, partial [Planctomycetales bacterium]|nr:hypothetical protein [Planctomycetales bacterium]
MSETLVPGETQPVGSSSKDRSATRTAGRLAINAAFLQEIKEDNRQLKTLWDRLLPMLSHHQTAKNHWPELIADFSDLRDQLAIHFSLEEAYGYFDDAVDIAPHLSLTAESLKGQHTELFAQV